MVVEVVESPESLGLAGSAVVVEVVESPESLGLRRIAFSSSCKYNSKFHSLEYTSDKPHSSPQTYHLHASATCNSIFQHPTSI